MSLQQQESNNGCNSDDIDRFNFAVHVISDWYATKLTKNRGS
jgi:hypothetical protein